MFMFLFMRSPSDVDVELESTVDGTNLLISRGFWGVYSTIYEY